MAKPVIDTRERLIVALDVPSRDEALHLVDKLDESVSIYKIGYRLAYAPRGLELAQHLIAAGKQVFLDLKLHDIGNSVREGVESLLHIGASFLTIHAYPQTLRAAVAGRGNSSLKLLAVTVLTSYDDTDIALAGYLPSLAALVTQRARDASNAGVQGLIASAQDIAYIRPLIRDDMEIITPAIRPSGDAGNDQKRIMTPREAIVAGADRLVVGRSIVTAHNPKEVTKAILNEILFAENVLSNKVGGG